MKHHGRLGETPSDLGLYSGHSEGHERRELIGRATGSVHQEVVIGQLAPGGHIEQHLHAFEGAFYVLDGSLALDIAGTTEALGADDFVFIDRGVTHALRNDSDKPVHWFEVSAPQPGAAIEDTVFVMGNAPAVDAEPPYRRGYFDAAELPPPSGAILAGFGAVNVGGAALRIIVGPESGSTQFNLMVVQYAPGGFITEHDHAFEEGFYFLTGEIEAQLEGESLSLQAGDYCWSGVGSMHALTNRATGTVRWLETQAPQPPSRYQARFVADWERFLADES